jgi:hypothetical protein
MASRDVKRADKTRPAKLLSFPFHSLFGLAARPATHNNQNPHRRHTDRGHDDADRKWSWNGDRSNDRDRDRNYNRDRDGRSRSSKERDKDIDKKRTRIAIYLEDLDHRHNSFTLLVRRGLEVGKLGETIRERLKDHGRPLSDSARVRFYADARELGRQDVADSYATIWYRLVTPRDNDTWMITHLGDDTNGRVDTSLADEMVRCIEAGKTLADLRKVVARHMSIDDSNRIIIIARDGLRKGLLQGDMWQVRQIRSWFSRWLSIDVSPKKGYIIIEGSWGQYLLHPSSELSSGGLAVRDVKQWLETRLLNDVDRLQNSKLELKYHKIALTYRGGRLSNSCPIVAGKTYGLELPWHLEDAFAAEEAWLLPATETCTVCSEDRKVTELPLRITSDCKHKPTLCKDCLGQWIHSSMDTLTWERLKCPECPELLKFDDVRRYAFREDFDRYDALATRAALKSIRDFRWCLSTSCESGQIHDPKCKMFKCIACKAKHCVHHEVPWHSKETCEEYDKRNRRRRKEEKASEQTIKQTSKACPECKRAVHKFTGCNHITCKDISRSSARRSLFGSSLCGYLLIDFNNKVSVATNGATSASPLSGETSMASYTADTTVDVLSPTPSLT